MSERRLAVLHKGLFAGLAFAALILLAVFYSVVSGVVEGAASRRTEMMSTATPAAIQTATRRAPSNGSLPTSSLLLAGSGR